MNPSNIDIIIVNWNSGSQLRACVDSIIEYGSSLVSKLIVVDNNSNDGSDKSIEDLSEVLLIHANKNLGFAKACNLGARHAKSEYLLFLNPDAMLYKGSLAGALKVFESPENSDVGIVGIQLIDETGHISRTCARFPSLWRFIVQISGLNKIDVFRPMGVHMAEWSHKENRYVDQVMGAFFLVRQDLFEALSGFDERFFVYFEEVDFSFRARQKGWKSLYLADAQAFHAGGGTSRNVKATRLFYSLRSRLIYSFKHFIWYKAWLLLLLTMFVEPVTRVGFCLILRDWQGVKHTLQGYQMLWSALPSVFQQSRDTA